VDGRGGPADLDAGIAWLEKAAAKGHIFSQRSLLALEQRDAKSLLKKLSIKVKIIALAIRGAKAMSNDPRWEVWLRYRPLRSAMKRKRT
jgi:TPR repeat protein